MTKKKVTRVSAPDTEKEVETFKPSEENKKKAIRTRIFAGISFALAISVEVVAIVLLAKPPVNTAVFIGLIAVIAIFAVLGSILWKQANRLDPASEKDKVRFFVQNQLGFIIAVIAFLPLIVLVLINKDMDKKQKGIITAVAAVALIIASYFGISFNPPSVEQYTEQTARVEELMGVNHVYWTKSGQKYHLYSDCYTINTNKTDEIFEGTVADARALKNIEDLCLICADRAAKASSFTIIIQHAL